MKDEMKSQMHSREVSTEILQIGNEKRERRSKTRQAVVGQEGILLEITDYEKVEEITRIKQYKV